jgi:hypothetical protein
LASLPPPIGILPIATPSGFRDSRQAFNSMLDLGNGAIGIPDSLGDLAVKS